MQKSPIPTGTLEIRDGALIFNGGPELGTINNPFSAEGAEVLVEKERVNLALPGQMRSGTSDVSLSVPSRTLLGRGFDLAIRGRRLSEVLSPNEVYKIKDGLFQLM